MATSQMVAVVESIAKVEDAADLLVGSENVVIVGVVVDEAVAQAV